MKTKKKYTQKPKIVVSQETKNKLDRLGRKGMTYDEIINILIKKVQNKNGR